MRRGVQRGVGFWKKKSKKWLNSGLSQDAFCKKEGLGLATFQKWLCRLRSDGVIAGATRGERPKAFVPVVVGSRPQEEVPYCEIRFRDSGRLIIEEASGLVRLRELLSVAGLVDGR